MIIKWFAVINRNLYYYNVVWVKFVFCRNFVLNFWNLTRRRIVITVIILVIILYDLYLTVIVGRIVFIQSGPCHTFFGWNKKKIIILDEIKNNWKFGQRQSLKTVCSLFVKIMITEIGSLFVKRRYLTNYNATINLTVCMCICVCRQNVRRMNWITNLKIHIYR